MIIRPSRRAVLLGLGGVSLSLPWMPSLLSPREAKAAPPSNRCLVHLQTGHGGIVQSSMFPDAATLSDKMTYAGFEIRRGVLSAPVSGGQAVVSPTLRASSSVLTGKLVSKMNVLNGLDIPLYLGHAHGHLLGNYGSTVNGGDFIKRDGVRRTIDQIMAWSPSFYGDLAHVRERAIVLSNWCSVGFADPAFGKGPLQSLGTTAPDSHGLFDKLFLTDGSASEKPIVDAVFEDYKRLRDGNRRLSKDDKRRLEEHMARIGEVQRKLAVKVACAAPPKPAKNNFSLLQTSGFSTSPELQREYYELWADIVVIALSCGLSRLVVHEIGQNLSDYQGDWHQEIAHQILNKTSPNDPFNRLHGSNQYFFEKVLMDLVTKMEATDMGDGLSLLDHSLVVWGQESGNHTHETKSLPLVTFGSAEGSFKTGQYCDYRNLGKEMPGASDPNTLAESRWHGLLWHQWLGTLLEGMGVPRKEWENPAVCRGYPDYDPGPQALPDWDQYSGFKTEDAYPKAVWDAAAEKLPWLT